MKSQKSLFRILKIKILKTSTLNRKQNLKLVIKKKDQILMSSCKFRLKDNCFSVKKFVGDCDGYFRYQHIPITQKSIKICFILMHTSTNI